MTDLKYLEEVLPAYREGRTIELVDGCVIDCNIKLATLQRRIWEQEEWRDGPKMDVTTQKCWRVHKELVSWPAAWEALKAGKKIKDLVTGHTYRFVCYYGEKIAAYYNDSDPAYYWTNIPLSWLDREDFEVVE